MGWPWGLAGEEGERGEGEGAQVWGAMGRQGHHGEGAPGWLPTASLLLLSILCSWSGLMCVLCVREKKRRRKERRKEKEGKEKKEKNMKKFPNLKISEK
jgi:hypothetical protein